MSFALCHSATLVLIAVNHSDCATLEDSGDAAGFKTHVTRFTSHRIHCCILNGRFEQMSYE